jgi:hypothetical protein
MSGITLRSVLNRQVAGSEFNGIFDPHQMRRRQPDRKRRNSRCAFLTVWVIPEV